MTRREKDRQRRQAIVRATEVRMAKAKLKRDLAELPSHEGLAAAADIIDQRGRYEAATPYELIRACRSVGGVRASLIVARANLDLDVRLRDIAPQRRSAIAFDVRRLALARKRQNGYATPDDDDEIGPDD